MAWRETVAREKRRALRDETYWGRPLPGVGDPDARIVIVGLAPAAHGGNRTGRMFTGDRSADFLFAGLHRAGLANQPTSTHVGDGLALRGAFITAPCRCAPPANKPTPLELTTCAPFMDREIALLPDARVLLALGAIAWEAIRGYLARTGTPFAGRFAHGAEVQAGRWSVLGSYHVSQQNTQTGRLTDAMFDRVLERAKSLALSAS